jgi:microsomal dipeptidase-like Zn-dependent dipeptidase
VRFFSRQSLVVDPDRVAREGSGIGIGSEALSSAGQSMIADLHAHFPMHLVPRGRGDLRRVLGSARERRRLRDRLRAVLIGLASRVANYRTLVSGPRVRVESMREGGVGVALSVLYSFFDEVDLLHGSRPRAGYLGTLEDQITTVEDHVREQHHERVAIAHNPRELEEARRAGRLALVHCVEGGFHLGAEPADVTKAVERLAGLGVAYITLAHLIWRQVATDAPALPFMTDEQYHRWFPQPAEGLSDLGEAAVRAMVSHRVLIDVSHMSERALAETFDLLDELDPAREVPVIASHSGFRFGAQEYMLTPATLQRIAERDGVVGIIFAVHQLQDGLPRPKRVARPFQRGFELLRRHVDAIGEATGSHRHTALGSDFDGFIKPTLPGLQDMRDMARLEAALRERYGQDDADRICSSNALRMLSWWRGGP